VEGLEGPIRGALKVEQERPTFGWGRSGGCQAECSSGKKRRHVKTKEKGDLLEKRRELKEGTLKNKGRFFIGERSR